MHKFAFCRGSAADPVGGALSITRPPNCIYEPIGDGGKGEGRRRGERKEK